MKLSIITINLNQREGLQKTLASVKEQTFQDYEHILIDGGSTDGSVDEIQSYEHAGGRLAYWRSERDTGIFNAMNKGLKQAGGEYLLFLNAGDALHDARVLADVFCEPHDADVVYGDATGFLEGGREHRMTSPEALSAAFLYMTSIVHPASFIKRECFNNGAYDERFRICSDWAFFYKLFLEGRRFAHIGRVVCRFDLGGISNQARMQRLQRRERKIVLCELLTPAQRAACERELVLAYSPRLLRPFLTSSRMLQHAAFRFANAIRFTQAHIKRKTI